MTDKAITLGQGLRVSQISDALDELGLPSNAGGGYRYVGGNEPVIGRAFTVRQERVLAGSHERQAQHGDAARELANRGDILVIDAGDIVDVVTWGEAHTLRAKSNELAGVVIHGATRDSLSIARHGIPVLYRDVSPVRSQGRLATAEMGGLVILNGVRISQGDLVVIDNDGLVAIAGEFEVAVLERATEIAARERRRDLALEKAANKKSSVDSV